jgi:hypothetical protein
VLATVALAAARASAQVAPPPIGPFVVDLRGTIAEFGSQPQLAESRGLTELELPGAGFGFDAGAHLYFFRWKALTFGIGGQFTFARSHSSAPLATSDEAPLHAVTERFTSVAPQLSFNFGTGNGWSYISGGLGTSTWSIVPDGSSPLPSDSERLRTLNYGGGARWFINPHLAFHFDVRVYAIDPGTPSSVFPGSPRTTLLVLGAGVAVK